MMNEQTIKIENIITDIPTGKEHVCWTIKSFTDFSTVGDYIKAFQEDLWGSDLLHRQSFCIFNTLQKYNITDFKINKSNITKTGFEGLDTTPLKEEFDKYVTNVFCKDYEFDIDKCKELIIQHRYDLQERL